MAQFLPKTEAPEPAEVKVGFDLNDQNEYCSGTLSFQHGQIFVQNGSETPRRYSLTNVSEIVQRTFSGCSTLELVPQNHAEDFSDSIMLCRFSMSKLNEMGEFCKVINHYIETGETTAIPPEVLRVCPKCGRSYAKGLEVCLFCVDRGYVLRHTLDLVRPYVGKLLFASLLITVASLLSAIVPVFNARLVDTYLNSTALSSSEIVAGVVRCAAAIGLIQSVSVIFRIISQRRANRISCAMSDDLRKRLYDKIQRLSLTSISKKTSGDLMKRVTNDTETVRNFITNQGLYAVEKAISFLAVLIILMSISPWLTLLVLAPAPSCCLRSINSGPRSVSDITVNGGANPG